MAANNCPEHQSAGQRLLAADDAGIAAAAALLQAGGLVAVPTETVYGLAARAADARAVAAIYAAKGRPAFNPLIVHVAGLAMAQAHGMFWPLALQLARAFWPGPFTLVVPRRADAPVASLVTAGLDSIALRCPAHPIMQALIAAAGPLAAPSANRSGRISPTCAGHVLAGLADVPVIDGGACAAGVESTIVAADADGWRLLRPGAVAVEDVAAIAGPAMAAATVAAVEAPGMLASHYAPDQPVRLGAITAGPDEFHIGFGAVAGDATLSAGGDLAEAAARLFDLLHRAQASGRAGIAVAPVPGHGLGRAINDRLARAAAPRG